MNTSVANIQTLIADTCVLIVIAYLLARGRMLPLLFRDVLTGREALSLGLAMGLAGLLEAILPSAEFPYAAHTLFVTFAAIAGGLRVGLIAASVVTVGAFFFQAPSLVFGIMAAVLLSVFLGRAIRHAATIPARMAGGFCVGFLAQVCRLVIHSTLARTLHIPFSLSGAWISAPANGFAVALLLLIVSDAQLRAKSARAQALVAEAQLAALRARIHPHFLFNALNSIAELCAVAPDRAEEAIVSLSQLMRRALDTGRATAIPLSEEILAVETYLQIEQLRLGERLQVRWQIDPVGRSFCVPPFALQTLVENALTHGLASKMEPGTVAIIVRATSHHTLVAVQDNGIGMSSGARRVVLNRDKVGAHGLQIVTQHLILLYGPRSRLRLFSRPDQGTLAVFVLPGTDTSRRVKREIVC